LHQEERQEVVEDPIRESTDAVNPGRHSIEQVVGIDSAGQGYWIKRNNYKRAQMVVRGRCAHLVAGVFTAISESEEYESSEDDESSVELMRVQAGWVGVARCS
jgi:hypothetical protein